MEERNTGWEDLRVSATMMTVKGSQYSTPPEYTTILANAERGPSYGGLLGYSFGYGRGVFQSGYFHAQLPHSYAPGTDVEPHIHVRLDPGDEGAAGQKLLLEFEYVWVNPAEPRPANSTIISINYIVKDQDLDNDNLIISFDFISKPDAQISSLLDCRFSRITFDPAWSRNFWTPQGLENDSFIGNLIFKEFDFHYQKNSRGSFERYKK